MRSHADMLFGAGVLEESLAHFHMEAIKGGTQASWQSGYDKTEGIDFLWIVYTGRMRNAGNTSSGLFESIALNNLLRDYMKGLDQHEFTPGAAAKHRAECKAIWEKVLTKARRAA